jgi:hypothetical protein
VDLQGFIEAFLDFGKKIVFKCTRYSPLWQIKLDVMSLLAMLAFAKYFSIDQLL